MQAASSQFSGRGALEQVRRLFGFVARTADHEMCVPGHDRAGENSQARTSDELGKAGSDGMRLLAGEYDRAACERGLRGSRLA